jgi:LysM repeat protein
MNLPLFNQPPKKKKLQAATARRAREADFTEEPNVRLTSAFVVVLVLHVVAVGGIYAFNAIKAHQPAGIEDSEAPQAASPAPAVATTQTDTATTPATAAPAQPLFYRVKSGDTIARIATEYGVAAREIINLNDLRDKGGIEVGESLQMPADAIAPESPATQSPPTEVALRDSGTTYTVVRGDTPVSIARKLHVVYDDLIRLNRIEDPRKLKIGLKLKVPMRRSINVASN